MFALGVFTSTFNQKFPSVEPPLVKLQFALLSEAMIPLLKVVLLPLFHFKYTQAKQLFLK